MAQKLPTNSRQAVRVEDLGRLIREKRIAEDITLEQAARQSGVSASTLSRLERHYAGTRKSKITPDTRTITTIAQWLEVSTEQLLNIEPSRQAQMSTPDVVEAHLRADRNLDPEAAEKLGTVFRLAYEQFSKSSGESAEDSGGGSSDIDR
jgi:transcriptional regulator with XRE-family HTH domain